MTEINYLQTALKAFANLEEEDFNLSLPNWHCKDYKKGDYFNRHKQICGYLGFVIEGVFRSFVIDEKTGEEKNIFLYPKNQFVVTFKSFIHQIPCDYHTQALTDANVIYISHTDLVHLYQTSHPWEHFGRLVAQEAFSAVIARTESFLFKTPEERYLDLIKHQPEMANSIPLYHISSYLGIQGPSLSRIRKRMLRK